MKELLHTETIVIVGLVIALLGALSCKMDELAMSIASGLIGYIGRGQLAKTSTRKDDV